MRPAGTSNNDFIRTHSYCERHDTVCGALCRYDVAYHLYSKVALVYDTALNTLTIHFHRSETVAALIDEWPDATDNTSLHPFSLNCDRHIDDIVDEYKNRINQ